MKLERHEAATILVVDDEALIRWSVGERLRLEGARVLEAATLRQARRAVREQEVDLVILDIRLPDGDGVHFLGELIAERPGRAVVMISAHADDPTETALVDQGALCLLHKPFDVDVLAEAVARALAASRARVAS